MTHKQRVAAYRKVVGDYMDQFCKKNDMSLEFWVADDVGGVACVSDHFLNFQDIRLAVDRDLPAGMVAEWYETMSFAYHPEGMHINLASWAAGIRPDPGSVVERTNQAHGHKHRNDEKG